MNLKFKSVIVILCIFITSLFSLNAEEIRADEKSQANQNKTEEKPIVNEKSSKKVKENTEVKKETRSIDGDILKNPALSEEFKEATLEDSPMEHGLINVFYGLVSGGIMGLGGGLSFYTTSTNLTPLYVTAGALGAAGAITGVIITMIEKSSNNPLLGNGLFEYSWYGALGGAAIGGLIGLVPYSTTNDMASLLNWIGYGTFGGLGAGIVLFIVLPKSTLKHLIIDTNPLQPRVGYRFQF